MPVYQTLEQIFDWVVAEKLSIVAMIQQDEFSTDVIITEGEYYLVYDVT